MVSELRCTKHNVDEIARRWLEWEGRQRRCTAVGGSGRRGLWSLLAACNYCCLHYSRWPDL